MTDPGSQYSFAPVLDTPKPPTSPVEPFRADGGTFSPPLDSERLGREMRACIAVLGDGGWFTLRELLTACRVWASDPLAFSEAGLSARLRDLRKARYGRQTVERRRRGSGWEYRWVR